VCSPALRRAGRRHGSRASREQRLSASERQQAAEVEAAPRRDHAQALLEHGERRRVLFEADLESLGQAACSEIVMSGAETAADDQQVGSGGQREAQRLNEAPFIVGDREQADHLDAAVAEVGAQKRSIGVPGASVEQLVAAEHYRGPQ